MKQVVIAGEENSINSLLDVKHIMEYFKRKGIEAYCYESNLDDENEVYTYIPSEKIDENIETYSCIFLKEYIGEHFKGEDLNERIYISKCSLFKDREDPILIDIVKEIKNEALVKIVEIPDNVSYNIVSYDFAGGEYIEEVHRCWY